MTLLPLDARLPVLLARLHAAPTDAQAGLRRHAEVIARACGRTLDEVIAELAPKPAPAPSATTSVNDSLAAIMASQLPTPPRRAKSDSTSQERPAIGISKQIEAELRADPAATDRSIARRLGCSPTMPGRVRKALGLAMPVRRVRRGAQDYPMRVKEIAGVGSPCRCTQPLTRALNPRTEARRRLVKNAGLRSQS